MIKRHSKKIVAAAILGSALLFLFALSPIKSKAADILEFKPQIPIPGMNESEPVGTTVGKNNVSTLLPRYVQMLYNYGLSVVSILAAIMLMAGGLLWLTSGGDSGKISQAKNIIAGSVIGLIILFSAYIILNTINPELVKMKSISLLGVGAPEEIQETRFGCCACIGSHNIVDKLQFCDSALGLTPEDCKDKCKQMEKDTYYGIKENIPAILRPFSFSYVNLNPEHKWNYKCGTEPEQINTCVEYVEQRALIFNSNFDPTNWAFDSGIEKQVGDISPELAQFLNCMRANLPSGVGKISSISDSNYIGNLQDCNQTLCQSKYPKCVHSCASCHYGGGLTTNKSYAVDFGDEKNMTALKTAAQKCDGRAYILDEGNHLHVSVSKCPRN